MCIHNASRLRGHHHLHVSKVVQRLIEILVFGPFWIHTKFLCTCNQPNTVGPFHVPWLPGSMLTSSEVRFEHQLDVMKKIQYFLCLICIIYIMKMRSNISIQSVSYVVGCAFDVRILSVDDFTGFVIESMPNIIWCS